MSLFGQTLILYLVIGIGVAGAVLLADRSARRSGLFPIVAAVPFWPLYLPLLLTPRREPVVPVPSPTSPPDALATAIAHVEAELDTALGSLDGWAGDALAEEKLRIRDLRTAWSVQAQRIRDMDRILAIPEGTGETTPGDDRSQQSRQARLENIERLRRLRQRASEDLAASLTWVRELVSRIHVAKFNGSGAKRTQDLVAQIAAAVDGLSALAET